MSIPSLADCTLLTCDISSSLYGYRPSLPATVIFLAVASLCLLRCVWVAASARNDKCVAFGLFASIACVLEILGFVDRLGGWRDPWDLYPYIQNTVLLTIAPVLIDSSIFSCLGEIVRVLGSEHSSLEVQQFPIIFLPLGGITLLLQIVGFAIAFTEVTVDDVPAKSRTGIWVVVVGLALQMATLLAALTLIAIVFSRAARASRKYGYTTFHRDVGYVALPRRCKVFLAALPMACLCIFIRLIYRLTSFAQGLKGSWAVNQGMFIGFEGFLMLYALSLLSVCHPSVFLQDGKHMVSDGASTSLQVERDLDEASKVYVEQEKKLSRSRSKAYNQHKKPLRSYSRLQTREPWPNTIITS